MICLRKISAFFFISAFFGGMAAKALAQEVGSSHRLSPHLALLLQQPEGRPDSIDVLVRFGDAAMGETTIQRHGCRLMTWIGRVAVVRGTLTDLTDMATDHQVLRMESEPLGRAQTDVSGRIIHATEVHNGTSLPRDFKGKGVCCAILDHGLDFTHPAFHDEEGRLRITYFHDCTTGETYEGADLIAAQQGSSTIERSYHGSHVLGIMAGSPVGPFCGMAPGATILAADFDGYARNFEGGSAATILLAMKRLFDHADALGQPCVLNFSSSVGYLAGSPRPLEEECLTTMTGPGHIIVAAASNRGAKRCCMHKQEGQPRAGAIMNNVTSNYSGIVEWDLYTDGDIDMTIALLGSDLATEKLRLSVSTNDIDQTEGRSWSQTATYNVTHFTLTGTDMGMMGTKRLYHFVLTPDRGSLRTIIALHLDGQAEATVFTNADVSDFLDTPTPEGYADGTLGGTIGWPAISPSVIAVGATAHTLAFTNLMGEEQDESGDAPNGTGKTAIFSGRGPLYPGSPVKPETCAPGTAVKAPLNHFYPLTDKLRSQLVWQTDGETPYYWMAQSGTSMAAPMVAGIIALWLEAQPDLSPDDVRELLALSCTHPDDTLPYPNDLYGHGEIDAHRGILHLLGLDGIEDIPCHPLREGWLKKEGKQLVLIPQEGSPALSLRIYNTQGQLVTTTTLTTDCPILDLSAFPSGIYVIATQQGSLILNTKP